MLIEQFAPELENIISLSEPIQMLADDALERRYGGRMAARDCGRAGQFDDVLTHSLHSQGSIRPGLQGCANWPAHGRCGCWTSTAALAFSRSCLPSWAMP